ncbi:FtsH protease activity modulator HflK [Enterovibrio nigricans]|uniref:Protein HflK n=1 Tax=Enterovibrio nigricans DSM 22720 TaxID=1121868 RepID=A0A1T4UTB2_9GAMM|nr:FtsH protease activity modulator HflK [Enterovibrio nigricans]SKA55876.1 membrane protease subunit HflK [Enterovibrio nigricans DSM 22720]
MAWNEPGNNGGQDKDPRGNNNRGGRDQGPPDLDEVFGKLSRKLSGLFGGKGPSFGGSSATGLGAIAVVGLVIWGVSGFYTIGEAERGVVLRFGEYNRIVQPGLNWKPNFIDEVRTVNVEAIRSLRGSGQMLTKDENMVNVEMDVQYRVANPEKYLFSVTNADDSLRQATDSALRAVIGDAEMDEVLTTGRQQIRERTEVEINRIIDRYDMGLLVVDVNFDAARPPEQVKDAFDDAIAAREDEERFIREAEAYRNDILPKATGRSERLKKEALGYKEKIVNEAEGDVAQFDKLLPEYQAAPEVTRNRLYLETMENVFGNTSKVLIDSSEGGNNLLYLPLDKLMSQAPQHRASSDTSASDYGIELESSQPVAPASNNTRQSTTRQGRY